METTIMCESCNEMAATTRSKHPDYSGYKLCEECAQEYDSIIVTVDRSNVKRGLVQHQPDGETYVVEYAAVWQGDNVVGARIIAAAGPLHHSYYNPEGGPLEPSPELFDRIDSMPGLTDENAAWLQAEEDAGRLIYPIGVR